MNKPFFTADPHYGHEAIIKHNNRPFDTIEEHDETIISNYNSVVGKKDLCYILGDFAWENHIKYLSRLNGKKILIMGNHDKMPQIAYKQFTEVALRKDIKIDGIKITLDHYSGKTWNCSYHDSLQLYGHSHGRIKEDRLAFDVGVDCWNLKPISFETVKRKYLWLKENLKHNENEIELVNNSLWI